MVIRLFGVVFLAWVALRALFLYLAWQGDTSEFQREKVLRFFTETDIKRGKAYLREGFSGKVAKPFFQAVILLLLVFAGLSPRLHNSIQSWFGNGFWLPSIVFLFAFFFIMQLASLPFDYYLGYFCEKKMGFSNMTQGEWVLRYLKSSLVSWTIQAVGIVLVLWVFRTFERCWVILIPLVTSLFGIAVTLLMPHVITPLFYKQKPIEEGLLKNRIMELAKKVEIPIEGIFEIDESRYSKHTNAYFTGLFSQKRIVLYDTLIKNHTVDEALLIFAHEVGHWKHNHVFKGLILGFLGTAAACFILWFGFPFLLSEPSFRLKELWNVSNVPFFSLISLMGFLFFSPVEAHISQYFERQADHTSLTLTGLGRSFVDAEIRLARDNHSDLLPHPWRVFWFFSHPPAIDRIEMGIKMDQTGIIQQEKPK
ncbi:M48 family metallopeptidase [bacterium]|nr:M48 family metallopeptidase [bacterium]